MEVRTNRRELRDIIIIVIGIILGFFACYKLIIMETDKYDEIFKQQSDYGQPNECR